MIQTKNPNYRKYCILLLDVLIVSLVVLATVLMVLNRHSTHLASGGWGAFKYYTSLSNVFCALSCLCCLAYYARRGGETLPEQLYVFRLMGSAVVMVTFLVVVCFLGPIYGYRFMYKGANLWFHLVVPLLSVPEMLLQRPPRRLPLRVTLWGVAPTLLYGVVYLIVNAVTWTGTRNPATDIYGFLFWGWGIGSVFLIVICLISWLIAVVYRLLGQKLHRAQDQGSSGSGKAS